MNVLNNVLTGLGQFTCAEISQMNGPLWRQFWETRTTIWTQKYPEKPGADGFESDEHDKDSSFIVLVDGDPNIGRVIAGCRLIHAEVGSELPVGGCTYKSKCIRGRAVEVSRFFFAPEPGTGPEESELLLKQFIAGITNFLKGQGYKRAYATIRASLFARLGVFGVPMDRIGPDQGHGIRKFVPAMMFEEKKVPAKKRAPAKKSPTSKKVAA